ncbi:replication associated protein [Lake Sarah-associated circular virus-32]|uniref:replication associated protein n=1 Tax=Lake Sarah-associated circular virus-32 TaxID=1685760 RepID=UPI00077797A8|nr:replication associated protein [Lake Sarah-associated circular virus-32]ALE29721.1 replication associated protein [Lake Sarah-associated circular virus-32]
MLIPIRRRSLRIHLWIQPSAPPCGQSKTIKPRPSQPKLSVRMTSFSSKRWCFTLNNYSPEEHQALQLAFKASTVKYAVIGIEKGESGTPHLQGFVVFKKMQRLSALKKLNPRAHYEEAKGTSQQASTYCQKEGIFEEFGTCPLEPTAIASNASNKKNEQYRKAMDLAKLGDFSAIEQEWPGLWLRHRNAFLSAPRDFGIRPKDLDYLPGIWIWGPAGVGKSRLAREVFPLSYEKRLNKWFDGYSAQKAVLIEDIDQSHRYISHDLKIWTDRYSFPAEIKGGAIQCRPEHVLITSQYHIHDIWDDVQTREAIGRRCFVIYIDKATPNAYKSSLSALNHLIRSRAPVGECTVVPVAPSDVSASAHVAPSPPVATLPVLFPDPSDLSVLD